MTNENLTIGCEELLDLKQEYPFEIAVIMEMLAEVGEDYHDELYQLEHSLQSAA